MGGETNLNNILANLNPVINKGNYVYCQTENIESFPLSKILFFFRENEAVTIVLTKEDAEELGLEFSYVAAWITLDVHSSLAAVGLTAVFSQTLGEANISCNVVAAYLHDHIFIDRKDADEALKVLLELKEKSAENESAQH